MKIRDSSEFLKNKLVGKCLPIVAAVVPLSLVPVPVHAMVSIIVSATIDLNFGEVTVGTAGGTVEISPAGVRTKTGTVNLISGAGLESQAILSISGSTGVLVDVSMTLASFTVDDPGAGAPMTVSGFDIDGNGDSFSVSLATNPATFPVGATLTIPPGQLPGAYSGSYTVSVNYQ